MTRRRFLLGGALVLAIAGCGTSPPHPSTASSRPPAADAKTTSPATSPRDRAEADATSILASFVPPPGARKLRAAPTADGGTLGRPQVTSDTPDVIDDASWWQVPGQGPLAVLSWEASHVSRRFTSDGSGTGSGTAFDSWSLPPVSGVLDSRWLVVSALSDGGGGTELRAEAEVSYTPSRPAASLITAGAVHGVVVTALPGLNDRAKPPAPLIVTDPATVRSLVALVNGLPLSPPGVYSCPADTGGGVRLDFLSRVGAGKAGAPIVRSQVLAVAVAMSSGCGGVQLTINGTRTGLGSGPTAAEQALAIAGMHWRLFSPMPR